MKHPMTLPSLRRWTALGLLILLLASPLAMATDGTKLIGIGALQKGTGGAGVASPQDMTWVLMNPASIIDLGSRLDVSVELFAPYRTLEPKGFFGNNCPGEMDDDSIFYIPAMGYSNSDENSDHAWGIGLYGVSGMGVGYKAPRSIWPGLFYGNYDRRTEYAVATLAVAYAHEFGDGWSFGIAPQLNYSRFKTDMLTLRFGEALAKNTWDDCYGAGFSLGMYKHWDKFAIGATYTSRQWMTKYKEYKDLFFESMDLPETVQLGFEYDITPSLEWVMDYKWINWSGVAQMGDSPINGGFGWKDQHIIKTGLTWYASPKWTFRTGVSQALAPPIDRESAFANALFPALTKSHIAAGFSYALTDASDIHFTYLHAFKNKISDSGKGDLFSLLGSGTEISLSANTFTTEYSHKFQLGHRAEKHLDQEMKDHNNGEHHWPF